MTSGATHLVAGPDEHGVTRFALRLAAARPGTRVLRVPDARAAGAVELALAGVPAGAGVHLHVTDHLFGSSPRQAADQLVALAAERQTTVTLHDLPQPSDGRAHAERADAYARIARSAAGVVVCSEHEAGLLRQLLRPQGRLPAAVRTAVVPHPVEAAAPDRRDEQAARSSRDVAVLGFLYPGKGHRQALDALRDTRSDVGLLALGRPSPGHEDLVDELAHQAREGGRGFVVTGWLPDAELHRRMRGVAVPVVAHQHVSASGSLATWLSVGRRPVVLRSAYAEEVLRRMPGSLLLVDDLAAGVQHALQEPSQTWSDPQLRLTPSWAQAAGQLQEQVARWA